MLHVVYDGQCAFCIRALEVCRALDRGGSLAFHDATLRDRVIERFPELAQADFENAMFAVADDRSVTRGFFAFRRIARESPLMWPFLLLLYFPGSGVIGPGVYAWVASNRRRFGCQSDVCEMPQGRERHD